MLTKFITLTCATLLLMSPRSNAALGLIFTEVEDNVELTFGGEVSLGGYRFDFLDSFSFNATLNSGGLVETTAGPGATVRELYFGEDLLELDPPFGRAYGDQWIGISVASDRVVVANTLDSSVSADRIANVSELSAEVGGVLFGKKQIFSGSLSSLELDRYTPNVFHDMWRVSGTTGDENLIQFMVKSSAVPEPSSFLFTALGLLGCLFRRRRH